MATTIKARSIIEIMGTPKEHVEKTMEAVMEKLRSRKDFVLESEELFEVTQVTDKPFFSTFAEVSLAFQTIESVVSFCFDFMPSSLEIFEPASMIFESRHLANVFNDLLARLHQYDMVLKNVHAENIVLKRKTGMDKPQS